MCNAFSQLLCVVNIFLSYKTYQKPCRFSEQIVSLIGLIVIARVSKNLVILVICLVQNYMLVV